MQRTFNSIKLIRSNFQSCLGTISRHLLVHFLLWFVFRSIMIRYHYRQYRVIWSSRIWRCPFPPLRLLTLLHRLFFYLNRTVFSRGPLNYLARMSILFIMDIRQSLTHLQFQHIHFIIWYRWPSPSLLTMVVLMLHSKHTILMLCNNSTINTLINSNYKSRNVRLVRNR